MIFLLALPVLLVVAHIHRCLRVSAPSNVLARRVRASHPELRTVVMLVVLATGLLVVMKVAATAVRGGAPTWIQVIVLVLAWDAIKIGLLAITVLVGCCSACVRGGVNRGRGRNRSSVSTATHDESVRQNWHATGRRGGSPDPVTAPAHWKDQPLGDWS